MLKVNFDGIQKAMEGASKAVSAPLRVKPPEGTTREIIPQLISKFEPNLAVGKPLLIIPQERFSYC